MSGIDLGVVVLTEGLSVSGRHLGNQVPVFALVDDGTGVRLIACLLSSILQPSVAKLLIILKV